MWLVLCHPYDAAAHWAAAGLRARGAAPIRVVHPEELAQWCRWEHRIGSGGVRSRLVLADGCVVDDDGIRGVLNRLGSLPPGPLIGPEDQAYVAQELRALFWSWLASLRVPVVDPPGPHGFAGPGHVSEWLLLAARAGLPTPVYRVGSADPAPAMESMYGESALLAAGSPRRSVVVAGDQVFGDLPPGAGRRRTAAACVRLAAAAGAFLLGVDFAAGGGDGGRGDADGYGYGNGNGNGDRDRNGHAGSGRGGRGGGGRGGRGGGGAEDWVFAGANPAPDLRLGGEPLLAALARRLRLEAAP
jgi:hypothetical protein